MVAERVLLPVDEVVAGLDASASRRGSACGSAGRAAAARRGARARPPGRTGRSCGARWRRGCPSRGVSARGSRAGFRSVKRLTRYARPCRREVRTRRLSRRPRKGPAGDSSAPRDRWVTPQRARTSCHWGVPVAEWQDVPAPTRSGTCGLDPEGTATVRGGHLTAITPRSHHRICAHEEAHDRTVGSRFSLNVAIRWSDVFQAGTFAGAAPSRGHGGSWLRSDTERCPGGFDPRPGRARARQRLRRAGGGHLPRRRPAHVRRGHAGTGRRRERTVPPGPARVGCGERPGDQPRRGPDGVPRPDHRGGPGPLRRFRAGHVRADEPLPRRRRRAPPSGCTSISGPGRRSTSSIRRSRRSSPRRPPSRRRCCS